MSRRLSVTPATLALAAVALGCACVLVGVYLLAGLACSLILGGLALAVAGLVADV
jgi:hypothetical protein